MCWKQRWYLRTMMMKTWISIIFSLQNFPPGQKRFDLTTVGFQLMGLRTNISSCLSFHISPPPPAPPWIPSSSSQTSEIGLWMSFLSAFKFAVWSQGVLIKPSSSVRPTGIRPYCAEIQYSPYQLLINWHLCSFHSSKYRNVAHQVTSFDFSCNACHNRQESQWNRMDEEKQTSKRLSDMYSIW